MIPFLINTAWRILLVYWAIYSLIVTLIARCVTLTVTGVHVGLLIRHFIEGGILP